MDIKEATKSYEQWLAQRIPLLARDLRLKHERMRESGFAFLRATFYRWAQLWPKVCPELASAPAVLAVGDVHVENFGTWRDGEGRLIWGLNDFDEAARMPYANDLVRLAASARLAIAENDLSCEPEAACDAILAGYSEGLCGGGAPFVLAEHRQWLRELAVHRLRDPSVYWKKLEGLPSLGHVPGPIKAAVESLLPEPGLALRAVHRQAGMGSLGRRRFVFLADWQGGKIAREAKELTASAWHWEAKRGDGRILYTKIIDRAVRTRDPFVRVHEHWLIRRLAPDCSRIELASLPKIRDELKLLEAMGYEVANLHLGTKNAASRVLRDIKRRPKKWLRTTSEAMATATIADWKKWKS